MQHILLTGATGFLGSHLLEALLAQGYQVTILKRSTSDTWRIKHLLNQVKAFDVDQVAIEYAFKDEKVDAVIHTACAYGRDKARTSEVISTNLMFGVSLLEVSIDNGVEVFVNTDTFFSGKIISHHLFDYSLSKRQFAEWLESKSSDIRVVNLRLQHVYGPKDNNNKFIPWLIDEIVKSSGRIALTLGEQKRDFIYVSDVVKAYMAVISYDFDSLGFFEFDVGTGNKVKVNEFVRAVYDHIKERGSINSSLGFGDLENSGNEIDEVDIDIKGLSRIGWMPAYDIYDGIVDMLSKEGC